MAEQMSASAAEDPWSKLPDDLLRAVLDNIASPLGRVRFTAICRSWRAVASGQQPAPAFLWLILPSYEDGTAVRLFCPVDGAILRVPLPPQAIGKGLVGFHDGAWIAATSNVDGGATLVIVNLFSGIEVPLSAKQHTTPTICKIVFSDAPTSKRCILAASFKGALAVCRVGCPKHEWWMPKGCGGQFNDIAFCDGKLYGLVMSWKLFLFDIRMTKKGTPVVTVSYKLGMDQLPKYTSWQQSEYNIYWYTYTTFSYIIKHNDDRLLMALRIRWSPKHDYFLKVFEVVKTELDDYKWEEVTALYDHALFLSATCSKVVHVPAGRRGGIERNHIYYNHICSTFDHESICDDVHLRRCDNGDHFYCREEQNINIVDGNGIKSVGYYKTDRRSTLGWLLPRDF